MLGLYRVLNPEKLRQVVPNAAAAPPRQTND